MNEDRSAANAACNPNGGGCKGAPECKCACHEPAGPVNYVHVGAHTPPPPTLKDFITAVREMRGYQKAFLKQPHRTPKRTDMQNRAMGAEKKVDLMLSALRGAS